MQLLFFIIPLAFSHLSFAGPTEVGVFESGLGHELNYVVGFPDGDSNKIFINIEGDGGGCNTFVVENIKKLASVMATKNIWVLPETSKQFLCSNGQYKTLDFHHRIEEIKNLVTKLRNDDRFAQIDFYLMGSSGGVDIVSRLLSALPEIKGVILVSGYSKGLDSAFYNKELIDGRKEGLSEDQIQLNIKKWRGLFFQIKSNCSKEVFDWGDRSNLFWCQMFSGDVVTNLLNASVSQRVLIIHGARDDVIPVEEAYATASRLFSENRDASISVISTMGHKMYPFIKEIIEKVNNWAK